MIVFIDEHEANQLHNELVELPYNFDTWNHTCNETIISIIDNMGQVSTETENNQLQNIIYDMEDGADEEVTEILVKYGFEMEE